MTQRSHKKAENMGKTVALEVTHVQPHFWQQASVGRLKNTCASAEADHRTEELQPKLHTENMELGFQQSS